ncbi:hypothetical protein F511_11800 [Dorcoceras hygrometricum]|uniref:Uncharacterized protein n=1 Tax=Dorcoceras hygrometricum TaxID=472368 RepID=A0A2Z7CDS0_9LAMI|nr:hypothetical protein F511_11800 [Dorcoceras hygrometricum]
MANAKLNFVTVFFFSLILSYGISSTEGRKLISKDATNLEVKLDMKRFDVASHIDRITKDKIKDELAPEDDEFRPTTPRHSPGVGHAHGPSSTEP